MKTVLSSNGQVILPAKFRREDQLQPSQRFLVKRIEHRVYLFKKLALQPNEGLVDWLRACPESDWFQSLSSETTDVL
jgi:hypothetical protein